MEPDTNASDATGAPRTVHILLVDDDPLVLEALTDFLQLRGWDVSTAASGEEALAQVMERHDLDLVLLDVNLPGLNGFEVLERSHEAGVVAPVIMISTSTDDAHRLRALGLGAEDYLSKPLDPDALAARVETVLGLGGAAPPSKERFQVGPVTVDLSAARVYRPQAAPQPIPDGLQALLRILLHARGQVVSRKLLLEEGLGIKVDEVPFSITRRALHFTLDQHIESLRHLIEPDPRHPAYLEKVFGQGYRLRD